MKVIHSSEPFSFTKYIGRRLAGREGEITLDAIFLNLHWEISLDKDADDFSKHLWQTVQVLKHCDGYSFIGDGQVLFKFLPKEMFEFENGTLSLKAESHLRQVNGLVGISGAYFSPKLLSASSPEEVFEAWTWMTNQLGEDFRQMALWTSADFTLKVMSVGLMSLQLTAPIGVAVAFYKASKLVNVEEKLKELKKFLRGNTKLWAEREFSKIARGAEDMIRCLANTESEIQFSTFALNCGSSVELTHKPDMYLDGVPVEVKSLSWHESLPVSSYVQKVIERANEAFGQKAKLAVLSIGAALSILGFQTRDSQDLCRQLTIGLKLARYNKKPVLLFYHCPWTQDVIAETKTLAELREALAQRRNLRILQSCRKLPEPQIITDGRQKHFIFKIK